MFLLLLVQVASAQSPDQPSEKSVSPNSAVQSLADTNTARLLIIETRIRELGQQRSAIEKTIADKKNANQSVAAEEAEVKLLTTQLAPLYQERSALKTRIARAAPKMDSPVTPTAPAPALRSPTVVDASAPSTTDPSRVRVKAVLANFGFLKCDTDQGLMMIRDLPAAIPKRFNEIAALDARIERMHNSHRVALREAREADAVTLKSFSGDPAFVAAEQAKVDRARLLAANAADLKDDLDELVNQRAQLDASSEKQSVILALPTPQPYAGLVVWKFTGMAPDEPAH